MSSGYDWITGPSPQTRGAQKPSHNKQMYGPVTALSCSRPK